MKFAESYNLFLWKLEGRDGKGYKLEDYLLL